jgi:hypothetical protein
MNIYRETIVFGLYLIRETAIDDVSAVQIFENNVICIQNGRPQIFKFTNCFDASSNNVNQNLKTSVDKLLFIERYL